MPHVKPIYKLEFTLEEVYEIENALKLFVQDEDCDDDLLSGWLKFNLVEMK